MLVDDDVDRASQVEESLIASGFEVLSIISSNSALLYQIEQHRPDVVLIDLQFPGRDILESLAVVNDHNPTPMVMFSQENDPEYIRQAFRAGISTYLMDGIQPEKVKPIIDVALEQFHSFQQLRDELRTTRSQLEDQKLVARAKSLLMSRKRMDEARAHQLLIRMAMDNNLKVGDIARTVIATLGNEKENGKGKDGA
jgi:response regulator NasT